MKSIFRFGNGVTNAESKLPLEFSSLAVNPNVVNPISNQLDKIKKASVNKLVEIIIVPDRYFADEEVLQTLQVRNVAHGKKNGIGIVIIASDVASILTIPAFQEVLSKVYKISTIRHGFSNEIKDENTHLLVATATKCVQLNAPLWEIVIRACWGTGSVDKEIFHPLGTDRNLYDELKTHCIELLSLGFLHGIIGEEGTKEYKYLKHLTLRTQTINFRNYNFFADVKTSVAYSLRRILDENPLLQYLSVKAYCGVVNPVPEHNPTRMGLWGPRKRSINLSHPKAIRLLPSQSADRQDDSHLVRTTSNKL